MSWFRFRLDHKLFFGPHGINLEMPIMLKKAVEQGICFLEKKQIPITA